MYSSSERGSIRLHTILSHLTVNHISCLKTQNAEIGKEVSLSPLHLRIVSKSTNERQILTESWNPKQTALIICDMWNVHWCHAATRRVKELAPRICTFVNNGRHLGCTIIHCPSGVTEFYEDNEARKRAKRVRPDSKSPVPFSKRSRWGYPWTWPDADEEPELPIDDSDGGCSCNHECKNGAPWTHQHNDISISSSDYISDDGQEVYNILCHEGIERVLVMGVHLNMCVLGRPFAVRQLLRFGLKVAIVRDLTDTMYNPKMWPKVNHFVGTKLVIEHVEKYLCPSLTSSFLTGQPEFKFKETLK